MATQYRGLAPMPDLWVVLPAWKAVAANIWRLAYIIDDIPEHADSRLVHPMTDGEQWHRNP